MLGWRGGGEAVDMWADVLFVYRLCLYIHLPLLYSTAIYLVVRLTMDW